MPAPILSISSSIITQLRAPARRMRLDDVARQRADIGAPVAADLGLVMDAAEADADELPAHGAGDRLAERGLADAGRADEAEDRRLAFGRELAHGEIFDDAALDLVEAVVVLVEDAARLLEVDRLLRRQRPRQLDQPVEIGADHAVLGGRLRHALEPAQLVPRLLLDLLRHLGLGDRLAQLGDLGFLAVAFAELALDRRHLLAQQHLALALVEGGVGLLADLLGEPQHLDPLGEEARDAVDAGGEVDGLEHLLLLLGRQVEIGGDDVGERAGIGDCGWSAISSCGTCGRSSSASSACRFRLRKRASISGDRASASRSARSAPPGTASRGGTRRCGSAARPGRRGGASRPCRSGSGRHWRPCRSGRGRSRRARRPRGRAG